MCPVKGEKIFPALRYDIIPSHKHNIRREKARSVVIFGKVETLLIVINNLINVKSKTNVILKSTLTGHRAVFT